MRARCAELATGTASAINCWSACETMTPSLRSSDFKLSRTQKMADLDHWNFADQFTGAEASCLILGLDPAKPKAETREIREMLGQLKEAYISAINHYFDWFDKDGQVDSQTNPSEDDYLKLLPSAETLYAKLIVKPSCRQQIKEGVEPHSEPEQPCVIDPKALQSSAMQLPRKPQQIQDASNGLLYGPNIQDMPVEVWLANGNAAFESQTFSSTEMHRWLKAVGIRSIYCFGPSVRIKSSQDRNPGRSEWPPFQTRYLQALKMAAWKWQADYDRSIASAPLNVDIVSYLRTTCALAVGCTISESLAKDMATILRADGLTKGARPSSKLTRSTRSYRNRP